MSEGATRALIGIAALLVGFGIGWMVMGEGPAPPPAPIPTPTPEPRPAPIGGAHVIVVGPGAADVHPPRVRISKSARHVLFWIGTHRDRELVIESEEQLFEQQQQQSANGRWAMTCRRRMCFSDEIREQIQGSETAYKYWQIFRQGGQTVDEADGWIIIDR